VTKYILYWQITWHQTLWPHLTVVCPWCKTPETQLWRQSIVITDMAFFWVDCINLVLIWYQKKITILPCEHKGFAQKYICSIFTSTWSLIVSKHLANHTSYKFKMLIAMLFWLLHSPAPQGHNQVLEYARLGRLSKYETLFTSSSSFCLCHWYLYQWVSWRQF